MAYYAAALLGIAGIAEVLGLGGIPAAAVETENFLFVMLLLAFIAVAVRSFVKR